MPHLVVDHGGQRSVPRHRAHYAERVLRLGKANRTGLLPLVVCHVMQPCPAALSYNAPRRYRALYEAAA